LKKPFWFNPPYTVLFDLLRINRVKPWSVNVKELLLSFLKEMRRSGEVDFPASGIALFSSSLIHRMKSESVLRMEEPPKPPAPKPEEPNLPPLPTPLIKFEYAPIPLSEMVKALVKALEREGRLNRRLKVLTPPPVTEQLDEFLLNIRSYINEFYASLVDRAVNKSPIRFSEVVKGLPKLQVVRAFLMLLFLANEGKVAIEQADGGVDIHIYCLTPFRGKEGGLGEKIESGS